MSTAIGPWTYTWEGVPRPFVHPVRTPAGRIVSVDAPDDHPWQHALWFTIKFVNGDNFWEEYDDFGTLRQRQPPEEHPVAGGVRATSTIDWLRPDDETVVATERLALTHRPLDGADALDWDVRWVAAVDAELDRTPYTTWGGYGGLTLRGRPDWHDTVLRLPDGVERDQILGDRAPWCALDGPLPPDPDDSAAPDEPAGVMLLDHPANPGHPVPWYASTRQPAYGIEGWTNFVNAAFLWDGPRLVAAGDTLHLRYRFVVHDGRWSSEQCARAWTEWVAGAETDHSGAPGPS
jgi:hypothetical protein